MFEFMKSVDVQDSVNNQMMNLIADLTRRVKALEAKEKIDNEIDQIVKNAEIFVNKAMIETPAKPAPKVETFKELPDPIRCAYRTHNAINGFKAELIFNDENEYQTVRNLITRYNEGEIA